MLFAARSPTSFKYVSFWYLFLEPHLIRYNSDIGVQLRSPTQITNLPLQGMRGPCNLNKHYIGIYQNIRQMGLKQLLFSNQTTSPTIKTCDQCVQIQIEAIVTFLIIFGTHIAILFIVEVKIVVLIRWSYRSLPPPPNYVDY